MSFLNLRRSNAGKQADMIRTHVGNRIFTFLQRETSWVIQHHRKHVQRTVSIETDPQKALEPLVAQGSHRMNQAGCRKRHGNGVYHLETLQTPEQKHRDILLCQSPVRPRFGTRQSPLNRAALLRGENHGYKLIPVHRSWVRRTMQLCAADLVAENVEN